MSDEVLAAWIADEAHVRERIGAAGVVAMESASTLSGIEVFEKMFAGELPRPSIGDTMDFVAVHVEHGKAIFQGKPSNRVLNPMGTVHGGWYATLLDSAVGCAVHSTLPAGKAYTTLELKLNIVRAISVKTPLVRAIGQVIHVGRQVATAEARLVGHDGTLYAHATTTCLIFDIAQQKIAR
ncbi:MAG: PaaI family thioesterase [Betaproteobacteria bacterium]|nr:MAG: PaaI family thioesterase [Betaproteobacteria bacterium]